MLPTSRGRRLDVITLSQIAKLYIFADVHRKPDGLTLRGDQKSLLYSVGQASRQTADLIAHDGWKSLAKLRFLSVWVAEEVDAELWERGGYADP